MGIFGDCLAQVGLMFEVEFEHLQGKLEIRTNTTFKADALRRPLENTTVCVELAYKLLALGPVGCRYQHEPQLSHPPPATHYSVQPYV